MKKASSSQILAKRLDRKAHVYFLSTPCYLKPSNRGPGHEKSRGTYIPADELYQQFQTEVERLKGVGLPSLEAIRKGFEVFPREQELALQKFILLTLPSKIWVEEERNT